MADSKNEENVLIDSFKMFPVLTIIFILIFIYIIWRGTGGIERGEERREIGQTGILLEIPMFSNSQ